MKRKSLFGAMLIAPLLHAAFPAHAQSESCRIAGIKTEVRCGIVKRALDPANPSVTIDIHYTVLPALARNKKQDALFFFAGGPGQSAIKIAPQIQAMFSRMSNFRDIVLIDQRGTGKSANLECKFEEKDMSLNDMVASPRRADWLLGCKEELQKRPHGRLENYITTFAMQDADAVRAALGYEQINIAGGSYGTRAALEYMRLFPQRVRRAMIDGVAPPDMVLPIAFSQDNQAALDGMIKACEATTSCAKAYPNLRRDWRALMDAPAREAKAINPMSGREETITVDRTAIVGLARGPLYAPALTAALPNAITEAAAGRFTSLIGLSTALGGGITGMSYGMHFSVICSEDFPRLSQSRDTPGVDFANSFDALYASVCAQWPKRNVDPGFYTMPSVQFPVLVLSGGADPVTPPRHGERTAKALGAKAKHVVVPEAGHGVSSIGCMTDLVYKFFDAKTDDEAMKLDTACVTGIPRPTFWQALQIGGKK